MQNVVRVIVGIFALIGFAYVAMLTWFELGTHSGSSCAGGAPLMEVPSPTKAYTARVEIDNCTPSHELRTTVFLSGSNFTVSAFIAASSAIQNGGTFSPLPLHITWLGDTQLEIAYPRGTQLQSGPDTIEGVTVTYKEFTPYAP